MTMAENDKWTPSPEEIEFWDTVRDNVNDFLKAQKEIDQDHNKAWFAEQIGIIPATLSNYLSTKSNKKPIVNLLYRLSQLFNVPVTSFINGTALDDEKQRTWDALYKEVINSGFPIDKMAGIVRSIISGDEIQSQNPQQEIASRDGPPTKRSGSSVV